MCSPPAESSRSRLRLTPHVPDEIDVEGPSFGGLRGDGEARGEVRRHGAAGGARERRAELTARRMAQVAVRVVRPLTRAIRAGATTDGVEAALVETVEVALTFYYMSRGIEGE